MSHYGVSIGGPYVHGMDTLYIPISLVEMPNTLHTPNMGILDPSGPTPKWTAPGAYARARMIRGVVSVIGCQRGVRSNTPYIGPRPHNGPSGGGPDDGYKTPYKGSEDMVVVSVAWCMYT